MRCIPVLDITIRHPGVLTMFDFNSAILDVAIGVVLVYLLLALLCSIMVELFSSLMKQRSKTLKLGLQALLDGEGDANTAVLLSHPLIRSLGKSPSYIPARRFASALLAVGSINFNAEAKKIATTIPQDSHLGKQLSSLAEAAGHDMERLRDGIERWFDESMDRVGGWYKRWSQLVVGAIALIIVVVLNADTLTLVNALQTDPKLREQVVQAAVDQANQDKGLAKDLPEARDQVTQLGLPLRGWILPESELSDPREIPDSPRGVFYKVVGLLLTTAGVSLGAPFWFDTLKRLVAMRGSGPAPKPASGTGTAGGGT
jgi:hypothetical protein